MLTPPSGLPTSTTTTSPAARGRGTSRLTSFFDKQVGKMDGNGEAEKKGWEEGKERQKRALPPQVAPLNSTMPLFYPFTLLSFYTSEFLAKQAAALKRIGEKRGRAEGGGRGCRKQKTTGKRG